MGVTRSAGGRGATRFADRLQPDEHRLLCAMVGNPNVGKSSLFNALTGLHQHTGNWTGKTVGCTVGTLKDGKHRRVRADGADVLHEILLADLPGCYSLDPHSSEEDAAKRFLLEQPLSCVVVVCEASNLARNLLLAYQINALGRDIPLILCINLIDEAERQGLTVDAGILLEMTGFSVVLTSARDRRGLDELKVCIRQVALSDPSCDQTWNMPPVEAQGAEDPPSAISAADRRPPDDVPSGEIPESTAVPSVSPPSSDSSANPALPSVSSLYLRTEQIAAACVRHTSRDAAPRHNAHRQVDGLMMGKWTAIPVAIVLLSLIFWITISGANIPSAWLSRGFAALGNWIARWSLWGHLPMWVTGLLLDGVYRTLTWVIAVMLPPMAIFFPLFTLMEDVGLLPRLAFNFDRCFQGCHACGKQALTMCMGVGCNAAGVTGCRIIDSPRERMIAVLTNSLVPCNGKFPTLLAMCTVFFTASGQGTWRGSLQATGVLVLLIVLSVAVTLLASFFLSHTVLRGQPSAFLLEIPPYRVPRIGQVLIRSLLDRTIFVLGRAVAVAAPAGAILWAVANIKAGLPAAGGSWLTVIAQWLDPIGWCLCVDGTILLSLVLSMPANELTLPVLLMIYAAGGTLVDYGSLAELGAILSSYGWHGLTAVGFTALFMFHAPCATTLLTVKKETGQWRWTLLAAVIPGAVGLLICLGLRGISLLFG